MTALARTFKYEILNGKVFFLSLLISFLYFSFSVYLLNYRLVFQTTLGDFSIGYKFKLLFELLQGVQTAFSPMDVTLSLITALLVGINIVLLFKTFKLL